MLKPLLIAICANLVSLPLFAAPPPGEGMSFGEMPLLFEENTGHFDANALFVARRPGYRLFLTRTGSSLVLRNGGANDGCTTALETRFVGANPDPRVLGEGQTPTRIHYFIGNDPDHHSAANRTFGRVRYEQLWSGVDLVMYEKAGELEYDFIVAPGADATAIRLAYEGVDSLRLDQAGNLVLTTGIDSVIHSAPILYQGEGVERRAVTGRFLVHADATVGLAVDDYDRSQPLVIDPVLVYATYLDGSKLDIVNDLAIDAAGDIYVCGNTWSTDLPETAGTFQPAKAPGYGDAMVAKFSADGSTLYWCTYLGGSDVTPNTPASSWDNDQAWAIDVDAANNVYVGGNTACIDYPVTAGSVGLWAAIDGFVTKLAPDGGSLVYSILLGGAGYDKIRALEVDALGHAYVAGNTDHSTFPTTAGALQTGLTGQAGFVTKLAPDGLSLVYSTVLNGSATVNGSIKPKTLISDLHIDSLGRAYCAGTTDAIDIPTVNAFQPALGPSPHVFGDGFLMRLSSDGTTMEYGTYLGGSASEGSTSNHAGVAADESGRVWFTCQSRSVDYPVTPGAFQPTRSGGYNAVVTCMDTNAVGAASMLWSTYLGGGEDVGLDVEIDAARNAYVFGFTGSAFPLIEPWQGDRNSNDFFITVFDEVGTALFSTLFGGDGADLYGYKWVGHIALDPDGNMVIASSTTSTDIATPGAFQTEYIPNGEPAGVLAKFTAIDSLADWLVRTPCVGQAPPESLFPLSGAVLGQTLSVAMGYPQGGGPGSAQSYWLISTAPDPAYPCGTPVPGMGPNGTTGELLIQLVPPFQIVPGPLWTSPGEPAVFSVPVPSDPVFDGVTISTQGILISSATGQKVLTDALDLTLGM